MTSPSELLKTAVEAARTTGEQLRELVKSPREIQSKGFLNIVTDADFAADRTLQKIIKRDWPDHDILSEESDIAENLDKWTPPKGYWWTIDPIDGTTNFSRGVPSWSLSVAVAKGEQIMAGAIFDVMRDHMFTAVRGEGTALNGEPVMVNQRDDLQWALCGVDWAVDPAERRTMLKMVNDLLPDVRSLRCWGTAALGVAHVAAGYLDMYFQLNLKPWDVAAALLMVEEAGGKISTIEGKPWTLKNRTLLVSNGLLHDEVVRRFQKILAIQDS